MRVLSGDNLFIADDGKENARAPESAPADKFNRGIVPVMGGTFPSTKQRGQRHEHGRKKSQQITPVERIGMGSPIFFS